MKFGVDSAEGRSVRDWSVGERLFSKTPSTVFKSSIKLQLIGGSLIKSIYGKPKLLEA